MEARTMAAERYSQWKSFVPVLYDWLANHNLVWPSLSCRWGPQVGQATYKNRQRLYLSEQFNEESRSPFLRKYKTIIHPGEVNRIRGLPENSNIVATHTDGPDVLIWDRPVLGIAPSSPDLVLTGHQNRWFCGASTTMYHLSPQTMEL